MAFVVFSVPGPPDVHTDGSTRTVLAGDTVRITCSVMSNPAAMITWLFNGSSLNAAQNTRYKSCNQRLVIHRVEEKNSGAYMCVVANEIGTVRKVVNLTVLRKYTFHASSGLF